MKERISTFAERMCNIPKMHGHTKIELTDIRTGEKQVIEHDNDFQSGVLSKYMASLGYFNNNPYDNDTWMGGDIWRNLVGGIYLFRDTIDNSGGEVAFMPSGNLMVANGSAGTTNSGNPAELGSFNALESSVGVDSCTLVFDWDTSHGNGTINSICLTSQTGGYIGYGNKSGQSMSSLRTFGVNQNCRYVDTNDPYRNAAKCFYNNRLHMIYKDGNDIKLVVRRLPLTAHSIFDKQQTVTTISGLSESYVNFYGTSGGKYITLWKSDIAQSGSTFKVGLYDPSTGIITEKTFTNSTGARLNPQGQYIDGYLYVYDYDNAKIYKFKFSTAEYVEAISQGNGRHKWCEIVPGILSLGSGQLWIDAEGTGTFYKTNGVINTDGYVEPEHGMSYDGFFCMASSSVYYNNCIGFIKNPLYLATINNLDSPVTKDATKTMKVTYTLTEVTQ